VEYQPRARPWQDNAATIKKFKYSIYNTQFSSDFYDFVIGYSVPAPRSSKSGVGFDIGYSVMANLSPVRA